MGQNFDKKLLKALGFSNKLNRKKLSSWRNSVDRIVHPRHSVDIGIVGKYTDLKDSYASVKEALVHAGAYLETNVKIHWIESADLEKEGTGRLLNGLNGILVPGGFGNRGIEGMINGIAHARKEHLPYLGLCLGMQLMAVEYARNAAGMKNANSSEFDNKTKYDIIHLLPSQEDVKSKGGTMRLGLWKCKLSKDSISRKLYGKAVVGERHRHRYEFNNKYRSALERRGLTIAGTTTDGKLVEFIEWKDSFGIATQSHPELRSRLESPAPLFIGFVEAALTEKKSQRKNSA